MTSMKTRATSKKHRGSRNGQTLRPGYAGGYSAEFQAMKCNTRDMTPHEGVMESEYLSTQYRRIWRSMAKVKINFKKILQTLCQKRISFVLHGAYGIASWTGRPRSTHDVDILAKADRNFTRALNALKELYPKLEVREFGNVTAFFVPGETESVIDLCLPHRESDVAMLETAIWVKDEGLKYRVPTLESALAAKYGAMLNPLRGPEKRGMDAVDFSFMVKHSMKKSRTPIDMEKLYALGELIWPGGGGKEILRLIEQVKAGKLPSVNNGN